MLFHIDHIGWITDREDLFEDFWCDILGYKLIKTTKIIPELMQNLFGYSSNGIIKRYSKKEAGPDLEIHVFNKGSCKSNPLFHRQGINHICLFTGGKGSREKFLKSIPSHLIKAYKNPQGWMNYFIVDYEGNWIELRENLNEVFTTSYNNSNICNLITSFVKSLNPKTVVEIGTQHGFSSILIGKALDQDAHLVTFDLFKEHYDNPPYAETHANLMIASTNIANANLQCKWNVRQGNYQDALAEFETVDLLHVDICNHYDNLYPILHDFKDIVTKGIILEGGLPNHWQLKYKYKCWNDVMFEDWFMIRFNHITIPYNEHNSITLITKA